MDQKAMFYDASRKNAELDVLFSDLVKEGLTKSELLRNIERRPSLWKRWENWVNKLPD